MAKIHKYPLTNLSSFIWFKDGDFSKTFNFAGTLTEAYNKLIEIKGKVSVIAYTVCPAKSEQYERGTYTITNL